MSFRNITRQTHPPPTAQPDAFGNFGNKTRGGCCFLPAQHYTENKKTGNIRATMCKPGR